MTNADMIRAIYAGWGAGDFQSGVEHFDPEIELVMRPEFPDTGTYKGVEGVRGYTRGFLEPWERITIESEELIEGETTVVAAVLQRGVGQGSGAETEFRYFHVWTLRDGRVTRLESVRDREDALAAAGL
jgi:ketosteroid isomerase-like protein